MSHSDSSFEPSLESLAFFVTLASSERLAAESALLCARLLCPYLVEQPYLVFALKTGKLGMEGIF
jgi:hypothetical protein